MKAVALGRSGIYLIVLNYTCPDRFFYGIDCVKLNKIMLTGSAHVVMHS